jgi:cytochrome b561
MIYPIRMRVMHWGVAAVVISALGIGFLLGYGVVDGRSRLGGILFQLHILFGVAAILFMLARILVRLSAAPPPVRGSRTAQRAAWSAHALLYILALSVPLLGYAMELAYGGVPSVLGLDLPDFGLAAPRGTQHPSAELIYTLHSYGGHVLAALLVVHVGAALWRTARARPGEADGLHRMWRSPRPFGPERVSDSRQAL